MVGLGSAGAKRIALELEATQTLEELEYTPPALPTAAGSRFCSLQVPIALSPCAQDRW